MGIRPRYGGLRVQGTASSPSSTTVFKDSPIPIRCQIARHWATDGAQSDKHGAASPQRRSMRCTKAAAALAAAVPRISGSAAMSIPLRV